MRTFEVKYFENTYENNHAKRVMEMFAWYNSTSVGMLSTVERQIQRIYQEWQIDLRSSEQKDFPVRPLHLLPKYYGEPFWKLSAPEPRISYLTYTERAQLQVEMTETGLVFSATLRPVEGILSGDFVVSMDQRIYIHYNQASRMNGIYKHSSILMSAPVLFAGAIKVDSNGNILSLSRSSGHYKPRGTHYRWVKKFLSDEGFQLPEPPSHAVDSAEIL